MVWSDLGYIQVVTVLVDNIVQYNLVHLVIFAVWFVGDRACCGLESALSSSNF